MINLKDLIEKLKSSPRIKGVFTAGTTASQITPASDIDLIVILDKNNEDLKAVYTMIENRFADIFFFDIDFVNRLNGESEVLGNNFDGMFLEWLLKGKVEYDPNGILSNLKNKITENHCNLKISDPEKRDFWIKTNYNFIANSRYYNSGEKTYHQALELRLLYSIIELVSAYFAFRNIPWRGEKRAIKYLEDNDRDFIEILYKYSQSCDLKKRMKYYQELFERIFIGEYQKWNNDFIVPISNQNQYDQRMIGFWNDLIE